MPSHRRLSRRIAASTAAFFATALAVSVACTGNGTVDIDDDASATRDASATPQDAAGKDGGDAQAPFDPGAVCAQELAYFTTCKVDPKDVNCGVEKFEAWCKDNQTKTESDQLVRAKASCLVAKNCSEESRKGCIYESYAAQGLSPAQKKLVDDYCATCEPGVPTCATAHTTYDPKKGIDSIDDLFIAAWELAEPLVAQIHAKCTGPAIADAGADAGTCERRFAQCAGGIYVDALPNCPK
jgi:hypothetical protein